MTFFFVFDAGGGEFPVDFSPTERRSNLRRVPLGREVAVV